MGGVACIARAGSRRSGGGLGKVGGGAGTVLAVASVVLADAGGQCARAGNLRCASSDAGLVSVLARVGPTAKCRRGRDGGGQSQDRDESVGEHVDDVLDVMLLG